MTLVFVLIAFAQSFLFALFFFPALGWQREKRFALFFGLALPITLSPLWIPFEMPFARLLAAMNSTAVLAKLYDLHVTANQSIRPDFLTFLAFLPNWFSVVWRRLALEPRPTMRQNLVQLGQASWKTAAAIAFLVWLFHRDWRQLPFILEHCVKALAVFLTLIPVSALGSTLWRLAGGRARDFMRAPLLAATPAEFWRRYNRPAQQFFYENVFKAAGPFNSHLRATLATFMVSGLVHEYVFGITLGRVQGYQTLFFLLQGLGVAATARFRPTGWTVWALIATTWIFNLVTSMLFFASINAMVPFYSNDLPNWLAGWRLLPK